MPLIISFNFSKLIPSLFMIKFILTLIRSCNDFFSIYIVFKLDIIYVKIEKFVI